MIPQTYYFARNDPSSALHSAIRQGLAFDAIGCFNGKDGIFPDV
jgi:hypothetical protein